MKNNKNLSINLTISAEITYNDLSLTSTKNLIKLETKNTQGIYLFKNEVSDDPKDIYIGSSTNISSRFNQHIKNIHSNIYLQNAMNKYGTSNFSFSILEWYKYNNELSKEENGLLLILLEQKYFDLLKPNYNINLMAGKSRLEAKHSENSKELIRLANLGNSNPMWGKTHSEEYKEFKRQSMLGTNNHMYGKPITEFVKQAIKNRLCQPVYLYDNETKELINMFSSRKEFIEEYNVSSKTVVKFIKSGKIWRDKYIITNNVLN
jgi:group I intron endonuclease